MFVAAGSPAYWAAVTPLTKHADPEASIRTAMTILIAAPAIVVGVAALLRCEARSIVLVAVSAVVTLEIVWLVVFLASF